MSDRERQTVDKFDGVDYSFWRMQIEDYLTGKDLDIALGDRPTDMKEEDYLRIDKKARSLIRLALSRNVAYQIQTAKSAMEILKMLEDMYAKPSTANKVHLLRRLFNLRMAESVTVTNHLNDFNNILQQLSLVEITFADDLKALILLSSLPESWDSIVMAVSASTGKGSLKVDDIRDLMLNEEIRRNQNGSSSGSVLNTENRGRSDMRNRAGTRGRSKSRAKSRSRDQPKKDHSKVICWNCDKAGHFRNQCTAPKKTRKPRDEANVADDSDGDSLWLGVCSNSDEWVIDSGASFHSCCSSEIMESYVPGKLGVVYLADNTPMEIAGKGDVVIKSPNGAELKLHGVRHIPGLRRNLLSVGQLDDEGYITTFGNGEWRVRKGAMTLVRGLKVGTLYTSPKDNGTLAVASTETNSKLWHDRLGHMSEKGLKVLLSKGRLPNLKSTDVGLCEDCIFGKQKKVSFSIAGREPRQNKLELVHSDVWGPAPVTSLGGASYYVTFIDDSTRKVWVYFLKRKSDVFDTFRKWKALVENETGLRVKCLRSDNGGEYEFAGFKKYCAENGIRMEKTIPGTPQQNGVAERMNRTLNERARCMRLKSGLPPMFWAHAINTAAFLINKAPSVPLKTRIPEEVWSGKNVNLSFLRIFGCIAYIMTDDRNKLEAKSVKCTFIGYGGDDFGYRFWDHKNRKVCRSRNVIFDETKFYKDGLDAMSNLRTQNKEPNFVDIDAVNPHVPNAVIRAGSEIAESESEGTENNTGESEESVNEDTNAVEPEPEPEPATPLAPRREPRARRAPDRYSPSLHYILLTDQGEPECYVETQVSAERSKWEQAMDDEMESLASNDTWELCELPKGKKPLHNRWVYRIKQESDGSRRYKARLVVKGFQQKYGVDYSDVFTPVVKMTTIRMILSMVAAENLELQQLDVKTAFLHGDLEEEIYMKQPEGYTAKGKEEMVCRLKRSLYGLKQAPRQWYRKFDEFMAEIGFQRCSTDHCCYHKRSKNSFVILLLYVDDMLLAGPCKEEIGNLKKQLSSRFAMKDLGEAKQMLGMKIIRDRKAGKLKLSQADYIEKVLARFNMQNAKPVGTPLGAQFKLSNEDSPTSNLDREKMADVPYASAIGSLMYAMVSTRPDIAHAVGVVSRFLNNPGKNHWEAVKWILRYLRGTKDKALIFGKSELNLKGYVDSDLAGSDLDKRRSTTGYVFTYGGTAVSWTSKLQKVVATSTAQAEYVAVSEAAKEMMWLQMLLNELGRLTEKGVLFCDNQSAIHLAKNPAFHSRTKHIELKYHFIRDLVEKKELILNKIRGDENPADMLTKVMTLEKLKLCSTSIGQKN